MSAQNKKNSLEALCNQGRHNQDGETRNHLFLHYALNEAVHSITFRRWKHRLGAAGKRRQWVSSLSTCVDGVWCTITLQTDNVNDVGEGLGWRGGRQWFNVLRDVRHLTVPRQHADVGSMLDPCRLNSAATLAQDGFSDKCNFFRCRPIFKTTCNQDYVVAFAHILPTLTHSTHANEATSFKRRSCRLTSSIGPSSSHAVANEMPLLRWHLLHDEYWLALACQYSSVINRDFGDWHFLADRL